MMTTRFFKAAMAAWLVLAPVTDCLATGRGLHFSQKRKTITARIVAHIPTSTKSTIGRNYDSYLIEVEGSDGDKTQRLAKLSYRHFFQDPTLPASFLDYQLLHQMRVLRDVDCDATWRTLTTRYDVAGKSNDAVPAKIVWSSNAPRPRLEGDAVIPCYEMGPSDYRSNKPRPGFAELVTDDHGN